jgi:flagellar FliL protein
MSDAKSEAPKSNKKLLIIIAAAVVVLGGGAGAFFALGGKDKAKEGEVEAKHEPKLPSQFVKLEPFVINFGQGSSVRFLQVTVEMMTRDPHMLEFLERNTPIIRNDLLLLFGNKQPDEVSTTEGKEALRTAALEAVRKIIAAEGEKSEHLEGVFFTSFVMQ